LNNKGIKFNYVSSGVALHYLLRYEEAILSYNKALSLNPDNNFIEINKCINSKIIIRNYFKLSEQCLIILIIKSLDVANLCLI